MNRTLQARVYEAHPEVSFKALGGRAMTYRKSRRDGRAERWATLREVFDRLPAAPLKPSELGAFCDIEDYIDALVCACTAARIHAGTAVSLPADPPRDLSGLRMAIWY